MYNQAEILTLNAWKSCQCVKGERCRYRTHISQIYSEKRCFGVCWSELELDRALQAAIQATKEMQEVIEIAKETINYDGSWALRETHKAVDLAIIALEQINEIEN